MEEALNKLREFKSYQENSIKDNKKERIIDINFYGKINLSKNDGDLSNERQQELFLVEKEVNGKIEYEFHTKNGLLAKTGKEGEIQICDNYKNLINDKELLLQLEKIMPLSLERLEQIEAKKQKETSIKKEERRDSEEKNKTNKNISANDIQIDLNKKITETKTFLDLVPEARKKGVTDVIIRRTSGTNFKFIGINKEGQEIPLETLQQTEGTNPTEDIIEVNEDGSKVKSNRVLSMQKIVKGQNQGYENEGFTVSLGTYGIPEINYYRRASQTDKYTSIPVNLKTTNQKRTDLDVREYIEKKRNTTVEDNITRAEDRFRVNDNEETTLENIDDNPYNDNIEDISEVKLRKAARRCKVSEEYFKKQLEKVDGDNLDEKIETVEENINEDFRGNSRRA